MNSFGQKSRTTALPKWPFSMLQDILAKTLGFLFGSTFLCLDTGINNYTLQRAFLDQYGMTPKSYLQSLRLNDAYKMLLQSDPETTKVTDVALSQGYWHMSQFAADYRRQFGELPSATLRSIY